MTMPISISMRRALGTAMVVLTGAACGGSSTAPTPDPWAAVDSVARASAATVGVTRFGLTVYDANDQVVFTRSYGGFTPDERVAVASASKMIAGLVLFDVIRSGQLSLGSTTGTVLGWSGLKGTITLRHLLSFTSGLTPNHPCLLLPNLTTAQCVALIEQTTLTAAPGTRYDYGGTHLAVAARMAEVVTGKDWNALYRERLADPLGLPAAATFFTAPRQANGTTNPLTSGGLRASMNEYAPMLATIFHRGVYRNRTVGTTALFDAQGIEPFPDVIVGESPAVRAGYAYRYGLTAWLECSTPATGCAEFSSPGAFGFTPWIDRTTGYYAILGMEYGDAGDGDPSPGLGMEAQLKPVIRKALQR